MSNVTLGQRRDFRALFDQLDSVALWTATKSGEFDYISAGFEGIWGIPPEDVKDDTTQLIDAIPKTATVSEKISRHQTKNSVMRGMRAASCNLMDQFAGC